MSLAVRAVRGINRILSPAGVRIARAAQPSVSVEGAPPLAIPLGTDRLRILDSLLSVEMDSPPPAELRAYAEADCDRFIRTLGMVPEVRLKALEIGSNPYFTTILMKQFRDLDLHLTNFSDGAVEERTQRVGYRRVDGERVEEDFRFWNVNVEEQRLPFEDGSFDLVLFCEVLEHMTNDPLKGLLEIKRVLRRGGELILTTPNVARLENVARLMAGGNLYDPYSGYGPYGRHNREYTAAELTRLMAHAGLEKEVLYTADVSPLYDVGLVAEDRLRPAIAGRGDDLGQYLFSRWRNDRPAEDGKPSWLYRSYPDGELV